MNTYITVMQSPHYHQISMEELWFGAGELKGGLITNNAGNTRTYKVETVSDTFKRRVNIPPLIHSLRMFNFTVEYLRNRDRSSLYETFYIPKKTGGLREINKPVPQLMNALRELKTIFETEFHALYHTSAFAYVPGRCTVDAVKRHQQNDSHWFCKLDLHGFFPSTTMEFIMLQLSQVFPFSEVMKDERGYTELWKAIELGILNGGLPQGTPLSPLLTNIMMIPFDYELTNTLRNYNGNRYVYTRYADDFIISSKYDFKSKDIEDLVVQKLSEINAPFELNEKKTRYGSRAGQNWNLGVMLNAQNEITVGRKRKKEMENMLFRYAMDKKNGVDWPLEDVMTMNGQYSYCHMVEPKAFDGIVAHLNQKQGVDVLRMIRDDLRGQY